MCLVPITSAESNSLVLVLVLVLALAVVLARQRDGGEWRALQLAAWWRTTRTRPSSSTTA